MDTLGPFELLGKVGRGAVATVYRARRDGSEVALKVLDEAWARDPVVSERFRNEAEVLRLLDHPNIVRLVDAGDDGGRLYMALEYVAGPTLEKIVRRRAFTHRESAAVAEKIARALAHAHSRGVIHADITPGNILIRGDGTPKLTDFGIARCDALPPLPVPAGVTSGTPVYMSPEQARGWQIAPRSDIYSLGAVLYEAATGRAPFRGSSTSEILDRVRKLEPPKPREIDPAIHAGLEECILRAMAKEPDERYPSAGAFADELDQWIRGTPDWFSIIPAS